MHRCTHNRRNYLLIKRPVTLIWLFHFVVSNTYRHAVCIRYTATVFGDVDSQNGFQKKKKKLIREILACPQRHNSRVENAWKLNVAREKKVQTMYNRFSDKN